MSSVTAFIAVQALIFAGSCFSVQGPSVRDGKLYFLNQSARDLGPSEKATVIPDWKEVLVVNTIKEYEGERKELSIFDFDGKNKIKSFSFVGDEMFLTKTKRIVLGQKSAHRMANESFILNENGKLLKKVHQPSDVFEFGHSDDDQIFWMLSSRIEKERPCTYLQVYSYNGELLLSYKAFKVETKSVSVVCYGVVHNARQQEEESSSKLYG
ncbi:MAG: hypothetical protein HY075_03100 [Deltaproteobacteria bacterium]|nr:hypothetical protein [Deltaproteobacteria bacterium]